MIWMILGSLFLLKYGVTLSLFLWKMIRLYLLPRLGMKKDLRKYGRWAVVTGATDGIGKAIAKQLAKRGINIVLISRSTDKLKAVAEEFVTFDVEVKTITYDFNNINDYEEIERGLQDLDIGILVNNVGVFYQYPQYFLEISDEFCDRLVNVNIHSVHKMTRIVLDGMIKRKRGLVVHVSSAGGAFPVSLITVYSACKAFVKFFSEALQHEYYNDGIYNQVLIPGVISTNMTYHMPEGMLSPSADSYAKTAVDAFALSPTMTGWWPHEILASIPRLVLDRIFSNDLHSFRRNFLEKQQLKED